MMEKKKPNLQVYLVDYQKKLRKFLSTQSYLSELDFIDLTIPEIKKEIDKYQNIIAQQSKNDCLNKLSDEYIPFWLSSGKEFLIWLEKRKLSFKKPETTGLKSFNWTGSQAQLKALCQSLKDAGYIDPGTKKEAFIAIFANELINCEAIHWKGSNRLLSYFFYQMNSGNKPFILSQDWQSIIEKNQLFINRKGKPLKAGDLSTALNSINDQFKGCNPKGSDKIDAILENLKTLRP